MVIQSNTDQHISAQVDVSKSIIPWITNQGYALLDVNLYPKPFLSKLNMKVGCNLPSLAHSIDLVFSQRRFPVSSLTTS